MTLKTYHCLGIGKQTVLELAARGVTVVMACRDLKRAESAKQDILEAVPNGKLVTEKYICYNYVNRCVLYSGREFSCPGFN